MRSGHTLKVIEKKSLNVVRMTYLINRIAAFFRLRFAFGGFLLLCAGKHCVIGLWKVFFSTALYTTVRVTLQTVYEIGNNNTSHHISVTQ